jgi:hypothetical protein
VQVEVQGSSHVHTANMLTASPALWRQLIDMLRLQNASTTTNTLRASVANKQGGKAQQILRLQAW